MIPSPADLHPRQPRIVLTYTYIYIYLVIYICIYTYTYCISNCRINIFLPISVSVQQVTTMCSVVCSMFRLAEMRISIVGIELRGEPECQRASCLRPHMVVLSPTVTWGGESIKRPVYPTKTLFLKAISSLISEAFKQLWVQLTVYIIYIEWVSY